MRRYIVTYEGVGQERYKGDPYLYSVYSRAIDEKTKRTRAATGFKSVAAARKAARANNQQETA